MALTKEEMTWVASNEEAIRALITQANNTTGQVSFVFNPMQHAAHNAIYAMQQVLETLRDRITREQERVARFEKLHDLAGAEDLLAQTREETTAAIAKYRTHADALEAKIAQLEADPKQVFLPLGTIVRFLNHPGSVNSLTYTDLNKSYPAAGSIGVVTRLNQSEYPIAVSMRQEFQDGYGETYIADYEHVPTFNVDRDRLEVIGFSLLPNGTENQSYGYIPTHKADTDIISDRDAEMILEANGFFWRYWDFGPGRGVELLQAFDKMEEMPWVKEPIAQ